MSPPAPAAPPSPSPAAPARLEAPASVDGFPRTTNDDWTSVGRTITADLKTHVSAPTTTVTELYLGEGVTDTVSISAVAGQVADPAKVVEAVVGPRPLKDVTAVDPGPLGGVVRCGTNAEPMLGVWTTCVWADRGSVGMLAWSSLDMKDRRHDFARYRGLFQSAGG